MHEEQSIDPDFRALFEAVPGLYLVLTPDLTVAAVSDAFARAMMTPRAAILGRNILEVFPDETSDGHADGADSLRASLERVLAQRRADGMAVRKHAVPRSLADGGGFAEHYWSPSNTPILDAAGDVQWIIHRVADVTELMQLQGEASMQEGRVREQEQIIERLRATNREQARRIEGDRGSRGASGRADARHLRAEKVEAMAGLAGRVAHDFNNLLGIIIGNLDMLGDLKENGTQGTEFLGEALDAAVRGTELARRLLAFAHPQPRRPTQTDINHMVENLATALRPTLGEDVEVSLDLGRDLWPVMIDPVQLEASLSSLATNAREAMPNGGKLIIGTRNTQLDADYASAHPEVTPGDYTMIEVSDTGTGMSRSIVGRIFEPFFSTKEPRGGAGLGLSTAFGFVTLAGGYINVYSEEGIGTTFRVYLPRLCARAPRDERKPAPLVSQGGSETVLVVEDDAAMRRVVRRQLDDLGYRVIEAERAASALRVLETERIDLLFTDIVTPGSIDGMALARTAAARWPELKILLTSGFPQSRLDAQGGASHWRLLSKPYRREELARVLREVLAERVTRMPATTPAAIEQPSPVG